ncbi:MAG: hypothetical protein CM1200mP38_6800 [Dehalococcoidia bacterium]|nr:MAG: hypothetical protein CM1200mP38_6800 [Dehalococcoidia bacterium]
MNFLVGLSLDRSILLAKKGEIMNSKTLSSWLLMSDRLCFPPGFILWEILIGEGKLKGMWLFKMK